MPSPVQQFRYKVVLLGDPLVGKTSLVHRYVNHVFDEKYLKTLGTVITKHTEAFTTADGQALQVILTIWDIMGQKGFLDLLKEAYFLEVKGALAVFDVTRRETLEGLRGWIDAARRQGPGIPIVVLGNKVDRTGAREISDDDATRFSSALGAEYLPTSAKTGLNVERAFSTLCRSLLRNHAAIDLPTAA